MKNKVSSRRRKQQERRALWFGVIAVILVGAAAYLATAPLRAAKTAPAAAQGTQVVASMAGFSPALLLGKAGKDLTLTFVNADSALHTDGGGWHQFRIDALGVDVKIAPRSEQTVTLQNLKAGTYEFYCDVCCGGKENPAMRGLLKVTT